MFLQGSRRLGFNPPPQGDPQSTLSLCHHLPLSLGVVLATAPTQRWPGLGGGGLGVGWVCGDHKPGRELIHGDQATGLCREFMQSEGLHTNCHLAGTPKEWGHCELLAQGRVETRTRGPLGPLALSTPLRTALSKAQPPSQPRGLTCTWFLGF